MLLHLHEIVLSTIKEDNEKTLKRFLKSSGLTPAVEVIYYWVTFTIVQLPIILFVAYVGKVTIMKNVTFLLIFLLILLLIVQSCLFHTLVNYSIRKQRIKILVKIVYVLFNWLLSLITVVLPQEEKL